MPVPRRPACARSRRPACPAESAVTRLRTAQRLVRDLGVNLAGAEVAVRLLDQLAAIRRDLATAQARLDPLEGGYGSGAPAAGPQADGRPRR